MKAQHVIFVPLDGDARREYINARETFIAHQAARQTMRELVGAMMWRAQHGREYLIRVQRRGAQRGLGVRGPETEAMFADFWARKMAAAERLDTLSRKSAKHARLSRAYSFNIVDSTTIELLNSLSDAGLAENMIVIGASALFGYAFSAGTQLQLPAAGRAGLLMEQSKRLSLASDRTLQTTEVLSILKAVDKSFAAVGAVRGLTAINKHGFRVDFLVPTQSAMREARVRFHAEGWSSTTKDLAWLVNAPKLHPVVIGKNGEMAQMPLADPRAFVLFKMRALAARCIAPAGSSSDALQAAIMLNLIEGDLPHYDFSDLALSQDDLLCLARLRNAPPSSHHRP